MRLTVSRKLNFLLVSLLLAGIGGAVWVTTQIYFQNIEWIFRKSLRDRAYTVASRITSEFQVIADRAQILGATSLQDFRYPEDRNKFLLENSATGKLLISLALYTQSFSGKLGYKQVWRITRQEFEKLYKLSSQTFPLLDKTHPLSFKAPSSGRMEVRTAELPDTNHTAVLRMGLPLVRTAEGKFSEIMVVELDSRALAGLFFSSQDYTITLFDFSGNVIASSDPKSYPFGQDFRSQAPLSDPRTRESQSFIDTFDWKGEPSLAAWEPLPFGQLSLVVQTPLNLIIANQKSLLRRMMFLAGTVAFLALALGVAFARTISERLRRLAEAAEKVRQGDLSVQLIDSSRASDEIHDLTQVFNKMVKGLEERDRMRNVIDKFQGKEIAEQLLSGELTLRTQRLEGAVLFSDIRRFTELSEKVDPSRVVSLLNEYFEEMVSVITQHGGIVDKFVGDAIMALWGVPSAPPEGDYSNAVMACIRMREALVTLNARLVSEGFPELRIGMGLHFGPLVAGNIGSSQRMDYSVIGDTVNTASRIESMTRQLGTDILISKSTFKHVKRKFVAERITDVALRGKSEKLTLFKIHGYVDSAGRKILIPEPSFEDKAA